MLVVAQLLPVALTFFVCFSICMKDSPRAALFSLAAVLSWGCASHQPSPSPAPLSGLMLLSNGSSLLIFMWGRMCLGEANQDLYKACFWK